MDLDKKYNFVYITTNLINGKQYIGDHSTDDLKDDYLGSGVYIKRSVNKYGRRNFSRNILEFFDSKERAFFGQEKWINEYNTLSPNGYNVSPMGGNQISGGISKETKNKISKTIKDNKSCAGKNNGMFGRKHSKEAKEKIRKVSFTEKHSLFGKIGEEHPNFGRKHSEEAKRKISEAERGEKNHNFGKKFSKEHRERISKNTNIKGKNNPMFGKKHSEEAKSKMREKALLRKKL